MAALAALATALPLLAGAKVMGECSLIAAGEGDQTDPSIDGAYVVFASSVSGDWDVLKYVITDSPDPEPLVSVAVGAGDQDQPDVFQANVVYRTPHGIVIEGPNGTVVPGVCASGTPVSRPAISARVATWECGTPGSLDVAVARHGMPYGEYLLGRGGPAAAGEAPPGDQLAPATFGSLVAFVDGEDGDSVWLHESDPMGVTTLVCGGRATGVSVGEFARTVVAVTRASAHPDADVEIWDAAGIVTALRVPGEQRNPHLSGEWVAFEDLTTGFSQVVLWRWTTPQTVFIPNPSETNQTLNDVSVLPRQEVRVVFADDRGGATRDVALYRLRFEPDGSIPGWDGTEWPWGPPPRPPPASCEDADPVVLGTLELSRDAGGARAGSVELGAKPFPGDPALPVLVCIEGEGVSAAWVALDGLVVAAPSDFHRRPTRLEVSTVAEGGRVRLSGVIAGRRGGSLLVRVLADPGRAPLVCQDERPRHDRDDDGEEDHDGEDDHDGALAHERDERSERAREDGGRWEWNRRCILPPDDDWRRRPPPPPPHWGWCGTGGGAGSLAFLALLFGLRLRRRRRSGPPAG